MHEVTFLNTYVLGQWSKRDLLGIQFYGSEHIRVTRVQSGPIATHGIALSSSDCSAGAYGMVFQGATPGSPTKVHGIGNTQGLAHSLGH